MYRSRAHGDVFWRVIPAHACTCVRQRHLHDSEGGHVEPTSRACTVGGTRTAGCTTLCLRATRRFKRTASLWRQHEALLRASAPATQARARRYGARRRAIRACADRGGTYLRGAGVCASLRCTHCSARQGHGRPHVAEDSCALRGRTAGVCVGFKEVIGIERESVRLPLFPAAGFSLRGSGERTAAEVCGCGCTCRRRPCGWFWQVLTGKSASFDQWRPESSRAEQRVLVRKATTVYMQRTAYKSVFLCCHIILESR